MARCAGESVLETCFGAVLVVVLVVLVVVVDRLLPVIAVLSSSPS